MSDSYKQPLALCFFQTLYPISVNGAQELKLYINIKIKLTRALYIIIGYKMIEHTFGCSLYLLPIVIFVLLLHIMY